MEESYLYIIVLAAAIVLSSLSYFINSRLVSRPNSRKIVNSFLVLFIFHCVAIVLTRFFYGEYVFIYLGLPLSLFYGPFLYLGLGALSKGDNQENKKGFTNSLLHFMPGIVFFLIYVQSIFLIDKLSVPYLVYYYLVLYVLQALQFIGYALYCYVQVGKVNLENHSRLLILRIVWVFIFMAMIFIGLVSYNAIPNNDQNIIYIGMFCYSLTIFQYYLQRLKNSQIVEQDVKIVEVEKVVEVAPVVEVVQKYEKSKVNGEHLEDYKALVEKVIIKDKFYLDSGCSLERLEKMTKISKHHLSQFFALEYNSHFNAHINKLRIEFAKKTLRERENNVSVTELGELSGFNSRTSFFRAFKKFEGMSPSEYIDEQLRLNNR